MRKHILVAASSAAVHLVYVFVREIPYGEDWRVCVECYLLEYALAEQMTAASKTRVLAKSIAIFMTTDLPFSLSF